MLAKEVETLSSKGMPVTTGRDAFNEGKIGQVRVMEIGS